MKNKESIVFIFSGLFLCCSLLFILDIVIGEIAIPFSEIIHSLLGKTTTNSSWEYIIIHYRLPKAITAILVGIGLSISGLLMQTLFRNPMAGPYVLGLSSGSSLGVAFILMGASLLPQGLQFFFSSTYSIIIASSLGSLMVLLAILLVSNRLKDTHSILIVGLMFGSFSSAIVSALTYFSTAEQLQRFTFWSMGNLGNLSWDSLFILSVCIAIGLILSILTLKALDALLLGEAYALSMGIHFNRTKYTILLSTSILTGVITAFVGPIAFIGLAVPHIAKLVFNTSQHRILFGGTLLIGSAIMLICDCLTTVPFTNIMLPINAITSIIGAPIVIWLLLKGK